MARVTADFVAACAGGPEVIDISEVSDEEGGAIGHGACYETGKGEITRAQHQLPPQVRGRTASFSTTRERR